MQVNSKIINTVVGKENEIFVCSDVHLGARNSQEKRFFSDLEKAKDRNARIIINGDLFDSILFGDKRYLPEKVKREISELDNGIDYIVDHYSEKLKPYANNIDLIVLGNHEAKIIKEAKTDIIHRVIGKIGTQVAEGGYRGFLRYSYKCNDITRTKLDIYYEHGSGGNSPVTFGANQFSRKAIDFDYDVLLLGHNHKRLALDHVKCGLNHIGNLKLKPIRAIRTGSYQQSANINNPSHVSYEDMKGFGGTNSGGVRLFVTLDRNYEKTIEVRF